MRATDVSADRLLGMDLGRASLMLIGIALHAGNPYTVSQFWIVSDPQQSIFFDWLSTAIVRFRMPMFFWISGYFCAYGIDRTDRMTFLGRRTLRLLLPLFATWATLNSAQIVVVAMLQGVDPAVALRSGVPVFHLWFLAVLWVYLLFSALCLGREQIVSRLFDKATGVAWTGASLVAALTMLSMSLLLAARATGMAHVSLFGITDLYRLAEYFPYFLAGVVMFRNESTRRAFLSIHPALFLPALALNTWMPMNGINELGSGAVAEGIGAFKHLLTWICVASGMGALARIVPFSNAFVRSLPDVSYSVYLCHHSVVTVLATLMLGAPWTPWLKFCLVLVGATIASIAFHYLVVQKSRVLRLAYSGRR